MSEIIQDAGVLFSNASHRVIFLNGALQEMLRYPDTSKGVLVGKPVHQILGMEESQYLALAAQIDTHEHIAEVPIEVHSQTGQLLTVLIDAIKKTIDGSFVGIDYTIHPAASVTDAPLIVPDIPDELVQEVVRFYFKRQLEGLHQTMTQWGGKKLGEQLNDVVNTTAQQQQWQVTMSGDNISDDPDTLELDSYRGLLYNAAAYVSYILGQKIMRRQIEKVNEKTNPKTFDYFEKDWYENL